MNPYYQDESITIYNADCRDVLPIITGDIVVTSPPHNLNIRVNGNRDFISRQITPNDFSTKYLSYTDNLQPAEYFELLSDVLKKSLQAAPAVCMNLAIVTGSKWGFAKLLGEFADNFKELVVWDKLNGTPATQPGVMNVAAEMVLVFDRIDPLTRQYIDSSFSRGAQDNIWRIQPTRQEFHGATFPETLVHRCLSLYANSQTIIDPFMGTGTTLRVSKNIGRKGIGIELDERYCEIAANRMSQIAMEL